MHTKYRLKGHKANRATTTVLRVARFPNAVNVSVSTALLSPQGWERWQRRNRTPMQQKGKSSWWPRGPNPTSYS